MKRPFIIVFLSGLLPLLVVPFAYLLNVLHGGGLAAEFVCQPFVDGCVSVSRAVRSGPGLHLFRAVMLPCAMLLFITWALSRQWLRALGAGPARRVSLVFWLGATGALFLVLYGTWLGTEGEWYRWLRRYGVTVFFGATALAQLLLAGVLWPQRRTLAAGDLRRGIAVFIGLVGVQWVLGILSVAKRLLLDDPDLVDRIENVIEWTFGTAMMAAFLALAWLMWRSRFRAEFRVR